MSLIKKKKLYNLLIIVLTLAITIVTNVSSVNATGEKPNLTITYEKTNKTTSTDVSGKVNEEIEVTYKVTPDPLALGDINVITDKEIVLVLDTSGSMSQAISGSTSRIAALRTAANNFIDKFKNETNVKIGIATYSTKANYDNNSIGLTSSTQVTTLKNKINNLRADGGTNIGDGIRYGLNMLNSGNSTAKKYIILMSDGEPTFYMYKNKYKIVQEWTWSLSRGWYLEDKKVSDGWEYYTDLQDDGSQQVGGPGNSDDSQENCFNYASIMATKIKENNYSSYQIAYSSGSSANKMLALSQSAGGKYFSALDATAIDQVYSQIADQIKSAYVVEGVKFNFTLPSNIEYTGSTAELTIDGKNYTRQLPNISYRLDTSTTPNRYIADPFYISFKFKASKSGSYTSLGSDWAVTYKGVDGSTITKSIPTFNYTVSNLDIGFDLTRNITGYSGQTQLGQTLQMNYSISPKNISVTNTRKKKQVVLLVDSSYSQKDNIRNFLSKFNSITDVSFSLVTYDTGAVLANFGTETQPNYFVGATNSTLLSKINSITNSTGSNLGEGLRKALFALNNTQDVNRRIVIFGENNPNYYSYTKAEDGTVDYYEELDNNMGSLTEGQVNALTYGTDVTKSEEYAKLITQKIVDTKNLAISVISSGDDTNDDVLKEVSSIASTEFNKLSAGEDITKLSNVINSDLIISARVYEVLPGGINFEGSANTLNRGIKIFYNYDNTNKCYVGIPVGVSVNMIPNQVGSFNLNNSKLYYTDIEGIELNKSFSDLVLNIGSSYDIKQGMFFKQQSDKGSLGLGESYITNYNSQDRAIGINSSLGMGALIKTNGQSTTVSIDVNSSNLSDINISNISTIVYKVNKDNTLTSISLTPTITNNGKIATLTFSIPVGTLEETYYLINYNYRIGTTLTEEEFNSKYADGLPIYNKCYIGTSKSDTYNYSIVGLPDLF
ncbi:hypothetical protein CBE01nite_44910 [Clostridium beijerinckii]|uniref:VWA domain-containing protein n=1 Tax=Clostridium beijerinckii TaxID=1520 RepID=A0AB74VD84_CLOBE|nr:VWA domain-containing protein [Clostridium beijerinckii]NRZ28717.1 hypothetical protein [Clostridium beijerinckii]NYB95507.1 hypothetical protein [Clostridium beijerinckii]OOM20442.1 von Willebrand factor type A domain protein [Clostridium beijerinckii]QUN34396.1 VWA domain-containing protein [Clostridium beijerinckii]SQB00650.1 Mg-chelatase subunit ChlD [Clostridium beijerinckii]